ncbi:Abnormal spindle-like microcephaly-associated protein, partial [Clarias magur]
MDTERLLYHRGRGSEKTIPLLPGFIVHVPFSVSHNDSNNQQFSVSLCLRLYL